MSHHAGDERNGGSTFPGGRPALIDAVATAYGPEAAALVRDVFADLNGGIPDAQGALAPVPEPIPTPPFSMDDFATIAGTRIPTQAMLDEDRSSLAPKKNG